MNYLELTQLAFSQNALKVIIYSLPAIFLCLLGVGNMAISCTSKFRNEPITDMFDAMSKAGNGIGLFIMGFIIFVVGLFCLPKFDWVELNSSNSKNFVEQTYAQNIKKINNQENPVYSLLDTQEREMRNFTKELEKQHPGKNFMFSNIVENALSLQKGQLLKCMELKKNAYLTKIENTNMAIKDIKEDIDKFAPECSVSVAKSLVNK